MTMRKRTFYPDDSRIRISCCGHWHYVNLVKGRLRFEGHRSLANVLFLSAMNTSLPSCGWILSAVRKRQWNALPQQLAYSFVKHIHRRHPRVGPLTMHEQRQKWHDILRRELRLKAMARYYKPLIVRAMTLGLRIEPMLDWGHPVGAALTVRFGVHCGSNGGLSAPLAVRQPDGSWEVDWNVAQEAALAITRRGGPHPFWGTPLGVCRVCYCRIPTSRMNDHVHSLAHNAAIQEAILAVFNPTSGTLPFLR